MPLGPTRAASPCSSPPEPPTSSAWDVTRCKQSPPALPGPRTSLSLQAKEPRLAWQLPGASFKFPQEEGCGGLSLLGPEWVSLGRAARCPQWCVTATWAPGNSRLKTRVLPSLPSALLATRGTVSHTVPGNIPRTGQPPQGQGVPSSELRGHHVTEAPSLRALARPPAGPAEEGGSSPLPSLQPPASRTAVLRPRTARCPSRGRCSRPDPAWAGLGWGSAPRQHTNALRRRRHRTSEDDFL